MYSFCQKMIGNGKLLHGVNRSLVNVGVQLATGLGYGVVFGLGVRCVAITNGVSKKSRMLQCSC